MVDRAKELLAELLLRWEELYERGQDSPASEIAKDHPELIDELDRRISVLKSSTWLDADTDESDTPASDSPDPRSPAPRLLAGRYRLDELIAEGGFAQVFRAYDRDLQRTVAIKVPKPSRIESTEVFLAEARRVARLKHPGMVQVYDVGVDGSTCFIVSEYVEGGSLADRLVHSAPAKEQVIKWIADIADALEYAHLNGVIHRDIKPANILIDHHGRALLADFGIAQSASKTGKFAPSLGTLRYMSPEQLEGKPSDHRSDIFSLAVVLHEALTGKIPYSSVEPNTLRKEIAAGSASKTAEIPGPIKSSCQKALSKSLHLRHSSAAQFGAELRRSLNGSSRSTTLLPALAMVLAVSGVTYGLLVRQGSKSPSAEPQHAAISHDEIMAEAKNLFFQGDFKASEVEYTKALALEPENFEALHKRGLCRTRRGAFKAAIDDFTTALRISPDDPQPWKHRAMAYASLREFEPAISDFQKTLQLDPGANDARESFGATYSIMAAELADSKHFEQAVECMTKAIDIYPEAPVFRHQRGSCYFHLGEYQKAIDDLNVAIGKEPHKPDHYENRGHAYQRMGNTEAADADFRKAKELRDP